MSELEEWSRQLTPFCAGDPQIQGNTVSIHVIREYFPELSAAPEGTQLVVNGVGQAHTSYALSTSEQPPSQITIHPAPQLQQLDLRGLKGTARFTLAIDMTQHDDRISITGLLPAGFSLRNGRVRLLHISSHPLAITLDEATLESARGAVSWEMNHLTLSGDIELANVAFSATQSMIRDVARIRSNQRLVFGKIISPNDQPIELVTTSALTAESVPNGSLIEIGNSTVVLATAAEDEVIQDLRVLGSGKIELGINVSSAIFRNPVDQPPLKVQLSRRRQLLDASSPADAQRVQFAIAQGSVCTGHPTQPLRLASVDADEGSRLQDVDCYALGLPELLRLEACQRFHPWIPRPTRTWRPRTWFRHPARLLEDAQLEEENRELSLRERAHYWATMTDILKKSHAPGWVQSEARYASARARRTSTPDLRERALLSLYAIAGYGERIMRPLLVLGCLAVIATVIDSGLSTPSLHPEDVTATLRLWVRYLLAPLTFFRLEDVPEVSVEGIWASVAFTVYRAIGIILIVFSLIATRRIAKAE